MGKIRILFQKSEWRPFGILRCRCENDIKMVLEEVGWDDVNCIHLAQDRDFSHV
jgi:hypothetical protein